MNEENRTKLKAVMKFYGYENQREIFVEECAEAIQAVQKLKRADNCTQIKQAYDNLKEEIADVIITTEQMKLFISSDKEIEEIIAKKLERQIDRMGKQGGSDD